MADFETVHDALDHTGLTGIGASAELDYVQITSDVGITGTNEGTANTVITGTSKAYSAIATLIEVYTTRIDIPANASGNAIIILLYDGASLIGRIGAITLSSNASFGQPFYGAYRLTPTAATHQYIVKAYRTNTNSTWYANSGGSGNPLPSFLRITRA